MGNMRGVVSSIEEIREIRKFLFTFGNPSNCGDYGCNFLIPPIGVMFEVFEPLQTQPDAIESGSPDKLGLTPEFCIPIGIYEGILGPGIFTNNNSSHFFYIGGSPKNRTEKVFVRISFENFIDWRGIRAVPRDS